MTGPPHGQFHLSAAVDLGRSAPFVVLPASNTRDTVTRSETRSRIWLPEKQATKRESKGRMGGWIPAQNYC